MLLEVVRQIDRSRYEPVVLFYEHNSLVPDFAKTATVLFLRTGGLRIADVMPDFYGRVAGFALLREPVLWFQKAYNLVRYAVPQFLAMIRILVKERIDVVCLNNAPLQTDWLLLSKALGRRCIAYFRGTPQYISKFHGRLFGRYDAILAISKAVTDNAARQAAVTDRFELVYDGIDTSAVRDRVTQPRDLTRAEFLTDPSSPLIGVVNNLKEWKGQHVAVEAMRLLHARRPDVVCLLIGDVGDLDFEYAERLRRRILDCNLAANVIITGRRDDVPDLLMALDIVLHTSLSNEGFPRVILEAMTLGRPIIASRVGPSVEMLEDGVSGFLVEADNPGALAAQIEAALSDPVLLQTIGLRAAKRTDEMFNISTNMNQTEAILDRVMRESGF